MKPEQVDKIAALADRLAPDAPAFRHQRLFSERDFDLYEEKGNYEEQRNELEDSSSKGRRRSRCQWRSHRRFLLSLLLSSRPGASG